MHYTPAHTQAHCQSRLTASPRQACVDRSWGVGAAAARCPPWIWKKKENIFIFQNRKLDTLSGGFPSLRSGGDALLLCITRNKTCVTSFAHIFNNITFHGKVTMCSCWLQSWQPLRKPFNTKSKNWQTCIMSPYLTLSRTFCLRFVGWSLCLWCSVLRIKWFMLTNNVSNNSGLNT